MKRSVILSISALIIIVGTAGFLYYRYVSSPEYSLGQIKKSFDEHDITKFEKYVDTKTLIGGVLDRRLNQMSENSTVTSKAEKLGEDLGRGLVNLMRAQVEELWTHQIKKLVETGDIEGENGKEGLDALWNKSDTVSFTGIKEVKKDGKVATISLEFNQPRFDTTLILDIKMRDKGGYWQLFDISNIFDYLQTIETLEEKRVGRINEEVKKQFFQNIKISEVKVNTRSHGQYSPWFSHAYVMDFENIGTKDIVSLTCFFTIRKPSGEKLASGYVIENSLNLKPGEKFSYKEEDSFSYDIVESSGIFVELDLMELKFEDGSQIQWEYEWADLKQK